MGRSCGILPPPWNIAIRTFLPPVIVLSSFLVLMRTPNAPGELLPEAGATEERTL
jgi:hypothetical protein